MDLFRIGKKSKDIFDYVSDLLDGERSLLGIEEQQTESQFESRADVDTLLREPLVAKRGRTRNELLFARLAPFYESGFCFKKTNGEWVVTGFFLYGKQFQPEEYQKAPFSLPLMKKSMVVRGRSQAVLKAFRLESIAKLKDSEAFVFDAGDDYAYLLLSEKPFPWLDELVQDTRFVIDSFLE